MLTVNGPFEQNPYDSLHIHFQLQTSQNKPESDPVVTWHQGGPGGSSIYGLFGEMGAFHIDDNGPYLNENSWNKNANMLYLESPAGSTVGFGANPLGFSYCTQNGKVSAECSWNDTSQAEAYARTVEVFFEEFPEFKDNDLYFTGESYAGQYVPNIANYILGQKNMLTNLKGFAVGNACWGGTENSVNCNGPNSQRNDLDLFHGKGLASKKSYDAAYKACGYDKEKGDKAKEGSLACAAAIAKIDLEVGPHNVYDIYDNCPLNSMLLEKSGKSMTWLRQKLRESMPLSPSLKDLGVDDLLLGSENEDAHDYSGGFQWSCGAMGALAKWFARDDVVKAMHLPKPNLSQFGYKTSGPASITLYPSLIKSKLRILIYNGDADSCVPYIGNEEWTTDMADQKVIKEKKAWHPWYVNKSSMGNESPAGYVTTYSVEGESDSEFHFLTIRLAGHMTPLFRPKASAVFFQRFLAGEEF